MPDHTDNPAGRLAPVLRELKFGSGPMIHRLQRALGLPENSTPDTLLMEAVTEILSSPDQIALVLKDQSDLNPERVKGTLGEIREALSSAVVSLQSEKSLRLSTGAIERLEDWSYKLHTFHLDPEVPRDELDAIEDALKKFLQLLDSQSNLDKQLECFLREHILLMGQAVWAVRIKGARALSDVLEKAVGAYVIAHNRREFTVETEESAAVVSSFWQIFGRIADAIQVGGAVLALSAAATGLIPEVPDRPASPVPAVVTVTTPPSMHPGPEVLPDAGLKGRSPQE